MRKTLHQKILDLIEKRPGELAPLDIELNFFKKYTQTERRIAVQDLVIEGKLLPDDNFKLIIGKGLHLWPY